MAGKMKVTLVQRLFARNWPLRVFILICCSLAVCFVAAQCSPTPVALRDIHYLIWFLLSILLGGTVGFFFSVMLAGAFVAPFYIIRGRLNGAPFQDGDTVVIINSGATGRIYEVWKDRQQVRVDIGEDARKNVTDVFAFTQVCKIKAVE